jgi:hypothetical protein
MNVSEPCFPVIVKKPASIFAVFAVLTRSNKISAQTVSILFSAERFSSSALKACHSVLFSAAVKLSMPLILLISFSVGSVGEY